MQIYRQGDVILTSLEQLPTGAEKQKESLPLILKHGSATGHSHSINNPAASLYTKNDKRYLLLESDTQLEHEEHATLILPAGTYQILKQREHTASGIREVLD